MIFISQRMRRITKKELIDAINEQFKGDEYEEVAVCLECMSSEGAEFTHTSQQIVFGKKLNFK